MDNVITSDHSLNVLETNLNIDSTSNKNVKENIYMTDILKHNLIEADPKQWDKLIDNLGNVEWPEIASNTNIEDHAIKIVGIIEKSVQSTMHLIDSKDNKTKKDGSSFSSNNFIPREVKKCFKIKNKATKSLRKVKNVIRCLALKRRILDSELKLKEFYENRLHKKEQEVFEK